MREEWKSGCTQREGKKKKENCGQTSGHSQHGSFKTTWILDHYPFWAKQINAWIEGKEKKEQERGYEKRAKLKNKWMKKKRWKKKK